MKLIIDLETNGLLENLDKIHCIVVKDIETNEVYKYNPDNLNDGLELLKKATVLIGHNIQGFDIIALDKVFNYKFEGQIYDTLLVSRLIYTNLLDNEVQAHVKGYNHNSYGLCLVGGAKEENWNLFKSTKC